MKFVIRMKQGARHLFWCEAAETGAGEFVTAAIDATLYDDLVTAIHAARTIKLAVGTTLTREDIDVVPWTSVRRSTHVGARG